MNQYVNETVGKANHKYSSFDASSKPTKYEIKSRRNTYSAFPTIMILVQKTEIIFSDRIVFVFNFTDELYYIVYDKEKFANYEI